MLLLYKKYKKVILYLLFGGITTFLNLICYYLCYDITGIANVPSTVIAWVVAVLVAYATNRKYVFGSQIKEWKAILREVSSFFLCRIATGIMDVGIMVFAVDIMGWNSWIWKLISNVLVVILNYIASKLWIF